MTGMMEGLRPGAYQFMLNEDDACIASRTDQEP